MSRTVSDRLLSGIRGRRAGVLGGVTAAAILLAGCNPTASSPGVTLDEAETATAKIEALGAFVDPYEGALEGGWWGSGIIVDSDGLAVTNNHVVVGAATLNVTVDGEEHSARILGSSECLDLAVIDIEGDGFPFFDWYEGDITAAQEVWALGFPAVGDTSFAVTRGIVSKPDTANDTMWASLDQTIEHDARIRGGNSGGPLVTADAEVVGVNYAGDDVNDLNLAIHRDEVLGVFDRLASGEDVLSLGINGSAYLESGGSGIFVSGVASGSVADRAGVEPGDIITRMEGVTLATDGTMADYCDILRTHGSDATLTVNVFRPSDGGLYAGQFNGDPLEPAALPTTDDDPPGETGSDERDLMLVRDDTGRISVQVPTSWTDIDGRQYTDDLGNAVYDVLVSTDVDAWLSGWAVSGVSVSASSDALANTTIDDILEQRSGPPIAAGCTLVDDALPYADGLYTGIYDWWSGCAGLDTDYVVVAAEADDGSHLIWVRLQMAAGDGWVLEPIMASFRADL